MNKLIKTLIVILGSSACVLSQASILGDDPGNIQKCIGEFHGSSAALTCSENDSTDIHYESWFPDHPCSVEATCATGVGRQTVQDFVRYKFTDPIINCNGELYALGNCPAKN